ncbi:MAG: hypothetical protein PHI38_02700 [Sulfurimonas sp.]|jgi:regulator of replication initiation timing|uniref:hypothetical protein n=1 Tax=Sulfurimonas sp. TaxID=2022749 RepID=UPI00261757EB|nr:hypothetical protein [Sulfurimonas sp.]MDD3475755.1 hypothetical protein [Sulfurimonas sp.]HUH43400.1 hypothetical protein [Sulfurimonas sp.]
MHEETTLTKLNDKISTIVEHYKALKEETETLRLENVRLKAESGLKSQEIEKLIEQNALKDSEIESIVDKLESIMA